MQSGDPIALATVIGELVDSQEMATLLQDPFANYVVQTSLSCANPVQHKLLVDAIMPHISVLRNTPYGKRIQSKIMRDSSAQPATSPSERAPRQQRHGHYR